jgi:hypothetical protein
VDDAAIVSKRGTGDNGFQLDTTIDRGPRTIGFKLTGSSGANMARYGATTLATGQWYFVTGVYDAAAQTMHVYLNGVLDDGTQLGTVTASQQDSGLAVDIGKRSGLNGFGFNGRIDEVRIYNRALSVAEIQSAMNTPVGSPLLLQGAEVSAAGVTPLTQDALAPVFDEAVARWMAVVGGNADLVQRLQNVHVGVMDLPGTTLGLASGSYIWIDVNAAGHGWFIDPTPGDDSEFAPGVTDSPAAGHADLLTVFEHELGHVLGLDDLFATDPYTGDVMGDTLPLGVRRTLLIYP